MSRYNLLYVEDDLDTIENMVHFTKNKFNEVYIAKDGQEALDMIKNKNIDLLILDINIPLINGLELAKIIRKKNPIIPILFLTAYSDTSKLLKAIDLQVDGYLIKPLNIDDLNNYISKIFLKLNKIYISENVKLQDNFTWNKKFQELKYNELTIPLTKTEIILLTKLISNQRHILSLEEIKEYVFSGKDITDNSIVQLISRLKNKTKMATASKHFFIENIYQYGYKLKIL